MRLGIALLTLSAALALPATAAADSGSITVTSNISARVPGYANIGLSVTVTKTTCDSPSGYCGWFPKVTVVAPTATCTPSVIRYVGRSVNGLGTYTQRLGSAFLGGGSTKLCLYLYSGGADRYVAETIVQHATPAPVQPAPATPPVTNPAPQVPALTIVEARASLPSLLRREFGIRFTRRSRYRQSCYRYSAQKVRCRVRWHYRGRYRYSGNVTMRNDPVDPENSIVYTTSIRRTRLK